MRLAITTVPFLANLFFAEGVHWGWGKKSTSVSGSGLAILKDVAEAWARLETSGIEAALQRLQRCGVLPKEAGYAVDVGGGVRDSDPLFPLYRKGWHGWMVDGDEEQRKKMNSEFPSRDINKTITFVYPHNIVQHMRDALVPMQPDLVKVDIDGFDCDTTEAMLAHYSPKVVIMEINDKYPPPVRMSLHYNGQAYDSEKRKTLYGCSLAYQSRLVMEPRGYRPVLVDHNNVVYVSPAVLADDAARACVVAAWPEVGSETPDLAAMYQVGYVSKGIPRRNSGEINSWRKHNSGKEIVEAIVAYSMQHVPQAGLSIELWSPDTRPTFYATAADATGSLAFFENKTAPAWLLRNATS